MFRLVTVNVLCWFFFLLNKNEVTDPTRGVDGFIKSDLIKFVVNLPGVVDNWHFIILTRLLNEGIIK